MNESVIIIDSYTSRRDKLAKLFVKTGATVLAYEQKELKEWDTTENAWLQSDDNTVNEVTLMLIHGGDNALKDCVSFKKRIWYSGNIGTDPRAEAGEEYIYMAIDERNNTEIDNNDAQELLKYASGKLPETPKCLQSEHYDPKLNAVLDFLHSIYQSNNVCQKESINRQIDNIETHFRESNVGNLLRRRLHNTTDVDDNTIRELRNELFKEFRYA